MTKNTHTQKKLKIGLNTSCCNYSVGKKEKKKISASDYKS